MNDTQYILDLAADKFTFVPDLASVLRLDPINPAVVFYLQAASLRQGTCLTLQVPGFRICTDQPKMASCPFIVSVAGADDFVCLCFKGNGSSHYLYGLSVEEVMKWEPPEKGDESEESVLRLINLKNASLLGAGELANTETCDLKDKVERLLKYLPTFNKIMPKVTTVKGLDAWVNRDFSANANAAVKAAEIRDRAGSRSKGVLAGKIGEGSVSAALGGDNKITWAETLKLLKQSAPYYDHSFSDRFILIENPADVSTARDFLKCAAVRVRVRGTPYLPETRRTVRPACSTLRTLDRHTIGWLVAACPACSHMPPCTLLALLYRVPCSFYLLTRPPPTPPPFAGATSTRAS